MTNDLPEWLNDPNPYWVAALGVFTLVVSPIFLMFCERLRKKIKR